MFRRCWTWHVQILLHDVDDLLHIGNTVGTLESVHMKYGVRQKLHAQKRFIQRVFVNQGNPDATSWVMCIDLDIDQDVCRLHMFPEDVGHESVHGMFEVKYSVYSLDPEVSRKCFNRISSNT